MEQSRSLTPLPDDAGHHPGGASNAETAAAFDGGASVDPFFSPQPSAAFSHGQAPGTTPEPSASTRCNPREGTPQRRSFPHAREADLLPQAATPSLIPRDGVGSAFSDCFSMITVMQLDTSFSTHERERTTSATFGSDVIVSSTAASKVTGSSPSSSGGGPSGSFARVRRSSNTVARDGTELINEYAVLELLGSGATASVLLCVDRRTNRPYAIKTVPLAKKSAFGGHGKLVRRGSLWSCSTVAVSSPAEMGNASRLVLAKARPHRQSVTAPRPCSGAAPLEGPALSHSVAAAVAAAAAPAGGVISPLTSSSMSGSGGALPPLAPRPHAEASASPDTANGVADADGPPADELGTDDSTSTILTNRRTLWLAATQAHDGTLGTSGSSIGTSRQSLSTSPRRLQGGQSIDSLVVARERPATGSLASVVPPAQPSTGSPTPRTILRGVGGESMRSNVVVASAAPQGLMVTMLPAFGFPVSGTGGTRTGTLEDTVSPTAQADGGDAPDEPLCPVEREIRMLRRLDHPHIVKLHKVIDDADEGVVRLVLDLVPNGPITHVQPFNHVTGLATCGVVRPLSRLAQLLRQLTSALQHLQGRFVVHNDLKPDNILMDEKGNLVLTDFGESVLLPQKLLRQDMNASVAASNYGKWSALAHQSISSGGFAVLPADTNGHSMQELTVADVLSSGRSLYVQSNVDCFQPDSSMFLNAGVDLNGKLQGRLGAGTPAFCAPELIDRNECSFKSDMWSVGVILYCLLFGRLPFAGATIRDTFNAVLHAELTFPSLAEVPQSEEFTAKSFAEWQALCRRLLVRIPTSRLSLKGLSSHPLLQRPLSPHPQSPKRAGSPLTSPQSDASTPIQGHLKESPLTLDSMPAVQSADEHTSPTTPGPATLSKAPTAAGPRSRPTQRSATLAPQGSHHVAPALASTMGSRSDLCSPSAGPLHGSSVSSSKADLSCGSATAVTPTVRFAGSRSTRADGDDHEVVSESRIGSFTSLLGSRGDGMGCLRAAKYDRSPNTAEPLGERSRINCSGTHAYSSASARDSRENSFSMASEPNAFTTRNTSFRSFSIRGDGDEEGQPMRRKLLSANTNGPDNRFDASPTSPQPPGQPTPPGNGSDMQRQLRHSRFSPFSPNSQVLSAPGPSLSSPSSSPYAAARPRNSFMHSRFIAGVGEAAKAASPTQSGGGAPAVSAGLMLSSSLRVRLTPHQSPMEADYRHAGGSAGVGATPGDGQGSPSATSVSMQRLSFRRSSSSRQPVVPPHQQ